MSDNREELQQKIKDQGEVVRKLKAAKGPQEKVRIYLEIEFNFYEIATNQYLVVTVDFSESMKSTHNV